MDLGDRPGGLPRRRRRSSYERRLQLSVGISCAVAAFLFHCTAPPHLDVAWLTPATLPLDLRSYQTVTGGRNFWDSTRSIGVNLRAGKGFGAPTGTKKEVVVEAPTGGWPTLSVIVLSAKGMAAGQSALQQLASQDYPLDRISEIIVADAGELSSSAPASLRSLLKDFKNGKDAELNLHDELEACSGDYIAIWGDDHVSSAHRLRSQVASASGSQVATLLQPTWFFDPSDSSFLKVKEWPVAEFKEYMEYSGNATMQDGFAELMVCADPLTLCDSRATLVATSANVKPSASPTDVVKELMVNLLGVKRPQIMKDLPWAAVRAPPSVTRFEVATPESDLSEIAIAAWPPGTASKMKLATDAALEDMKRSKLSAHQAISRLLSEDLPKLSDLELKRVEKAVTESLNRATSGQDVAVAIAELSNWNGLATGQGDAKAARKFPVVYAAFSAIRSYVIKNSDMFDMRACADVAEGLVRLGMKMWGADSRVVESLERILTQELYRGNKESDPSDSTGRDIAGTLSLHDPLKAVAAAAVEMREVRDAPFPVDALASLAWAFAESGIESRGLQQRVTKGVITAVDKLKPPDIGKLFIAMHEKRWFKDQQQVAYLTQAIVTQVRELKRQDPGLAKILAEAEGR